ncbi:sulfotransferase [Glaciecola sp. KUL10]|uniref:tetratricopeptide repeat-containing sulfotransferase family protein n=1 Tax=Glaciecola sp. (strain KUL10) TaxID=2161813 RepID=UPI000D78A7F4|nr:sulfotransferase [Glaciecola sp. KUL10]GBL06121.1 TPR repeat protein [Glaciecola sp. KUL10]
MQYDFGQLSQHARHAVQRKDWANVHAIASHIQVNFPQQAEGYFLAGLAQKAARRPAQAIQLFAQALSLDSKRYDAAIEKASQHLVLLQHNECHALLTEYETLLDNSPLYLDMAANLYTGLGLHSNAWPLYQRANVLQSDVDAFKANYAACAVLLGKVSEAKEKYGALIQKYPKYQKHHYEYSKLEAVKDERHIKQMLDILAQTNLSADKNIYLYYALAKEYEDLGQWDNAFSFYKKAGDAVLSVANYRVEDEIAVLEQIQVSCTKAWLETSNPAINESLKTPIFIVGLPRTGTTLIERIASSHSQIESADETFFMQMAVRAASGEGGIHDPSVSTIKSAAANKIELVANTYLNAIKYRLNNSPLFIDKYPFNYLYLGFIAKAFPNAKIVYLKRHPMDACFAMFKQSFFKFAYSLEDLGKYYVAQEKLRQHWQSTLGERLIELNYEDMVADQEGQTRMLLGKLGVEFEQACLSFELNPASSATASTLQVREKIHSRSVGKWKHFKQHLKPLQDYLQRHGIIVD